MVTITLRAKEMGDSGVIYQYWYSSQFTAPQAPLFGSVKNVEDRRLARFFTAPTVYEPFAPGEKIGIGFFIPTSIDYRNPIQNTSPHRFVLQNIGGTATGTIQFELYNATTKALITSDPTTINVATLNASPGDTSTPFTLEALTKFAPITGGAYYVAHFLAGGTGSVGLALTNNVTPAPKDGQVVKQLTGGTWTTQTNKQPFGHWYANLRYAHNFKGDIYAYGMDKNLQQVFGTTTSYVGFTNESYHRFGGITIPIGSTINSAILTIRHGLVKVNNPLALTTAKGRIKAVDDKSFTLSVPQATYPRGSIPGNNDIYTKLIKRTTGGAIPFLQTTGAGTNDFTKEFTMTDYNPPGEDRYAQGPKSIATDVTAMVQALVDKFDYSDDSMFFQMGLKPDQAQWNTSYVLFEMQIYTRAISVFNHVNPVNFPTGLTPLPGTLQVPETTATSQGVSTFIPKLVIDFSAPAGTTVDFDVDAILIPAPTQVDFDVDAILSGANQVDFDVDAELRLFPYLRSCRFVDAILSLARDNDFSVDANVTLEKGQAFQLDARLSSRLPNTSQVDANLISQSTDFEFELDSILSGANQDDFEVDGILSSRLVDESQVDANLTAPLNETTFEVDAIVNKRFLFNLDAHVAQQKGLAFQIDGTLSEPLIREFTVDASLLAGTDNEFEVDGILRGVVDHDFSVDANLQGAQAEHDFSVDSILSQPTVDESEVDAFLQKETDFDFDIDSIVTADGFFFWTVDSCPQATLDHDFEVDANIPLATVEQFNLDAVIVAQPALDFDVDALIGADVNGILFFTVDAEILLNLSCSFPDEDLSNVGAWAPVPLWPHINTFQCDGDFVNRNAHPDPVDSFEVGLTPLGDPGVSDDHFITINARTNKVNDHFKVRAVLKQSGTPIATTPYFTLEALFKRFVYELSASEADSITNYMTLSTEIQTEQFGRLLDSFGIDGVLT